MLLKFALMTLITLLLLIPLTMVIGVIDERQRTQAKAIEEVGNTMYAPQMINGPRIEYTSAENKVSKPVQGCLVYPLLLDYKAEVETKILHRSIYDITTYTAEVEISGIFKLSEELLNGTSQEVTFEIGRMDGLQDFPQITIAGTEYRLKKDKSNRLKSALQLPKELKPQSEIPFGMKLRLCGSKSLMFSPTGKTTTLTMHSPYPHPSFQGKHLPATRTVNDDGFEATWKILYSSYEPIEVAFVEPANVYQQATRTAKYGILVIVLVFVAGLLVEFVTKKEINIIQYAIIGLSLTLFYSLLLAFSEFIAFGWAYTIAALMTISALTCYFRGILKNKAAYVLGIFTTLVYITIYILLQMETYALLTGSLVLFILLSVIMYYTTNINMKAPNLINDQQKQIND